LRWIAPAGEAVCPDSPLWPRFSAAPLLCRARPADPRCGSI